MSSYRRWEKQANTRSHRSIPLRIMYCFASAPYLKAEQGERYARYDWGGKRDGLATQRERGIGGGRIKESRTSSEQHLIAIPLGRGPFRHYRKELERKAGGALGTFENDLDGERGVKQSHRKKVSCTPAGNGAAALERAR